MKRGIPYAPSWQNRFFEAIDKFPVPRLVTAFFLFLFIVFLNHLAPWIEGKLPWGEIDASQFNFHIWFLVVFLAFGFFLKYSTKAMAIFRPALKVGEKEYAQLTYRFINLSNRLGWITTFVAAPVAVFSFAPQFPSYMQSGISFVIMTLTQILMGSLVFAFFVNIFRQYGFIVELYKRVDRINIFHPNPLYAFAGFTSRTGIFLITAGVISYLTNVTFAGQNPQLGSFLFFSTINFALAVGAFVLPLGGIHARLVEEKERVSSQNDLRLESAYKKLHQKIDKSQLKDVNNFRGSISALLELRHEIDKVSTWPWEPGTVRNFTLALLVPMTAWVIQQVLLRTLIK